MARRRWRRRRAGTATSRSTGSSTNATTNPRSASGHRQTPIPACVGEFDVTSSFPDADDLTPCRRSTSSPRTSPTIWCSSARSHHCAPVLGPIAKRYQADLYLPTGEISDTQAYRMAQSGGDVRRPPDGGVLLLRLRPGRLADADLAVPETPGAQGGSSSTAWTFRFTGWRSHPTRSASMACHQHR